MVFQSMSMAVPVHFCFLRPCKSHACHMHVCSMSGHQQLCRLLHEFCHIARGRSHMHVTHPAISITQHNNHMTMEHTLKASSPLESSVGASHGDYLGLPNHQVIDAVTPTTQQLKRTETLKIGGGRGRVRRVKGREGESEEGKGEGGGE